MDDRPFPGRLGRGAHFIRRDGEMRSLEMDFTRECFPAVAVAHKVGLLHARKLWTASRKANRSMLWTFRCAP